MSDATNGGISRPLLIVLGVVVGAGALFVLWAFIVQPLLSPDEPDDTAQPPTTPVSPPPEESLPPLPDPDADEAQQLDDLLALGEVEGELFELAGARDPFRQVVVAAPTTPATTTTGGTGGTGTGGTGTGGTGGTGTGGTGGTGDSTTPDDPTGQYGTGDEVADAGPQGAELADTGLGSVPLAVLALLLLTTGTLTLRDTAAGPRRPRRP